MSAHDTTFLLGPILLKSSNEYEYLVRFFQMLKKLLDNFSMVKKISPPPKNLKDKQYLNYYPNVSPKIEN